MNTSLIYIHIGKVLPIYIYDSLLQSLLFSKNTKIYVIIDDSLIVVFKDIISNFILNSNVIEAIPLSILSGSKYIIKYNAYMKSLSTDLINFRENFWIYTTTRFFYIAEFIKLFSIKHCFHIETDVMIYDSLQQIKCSDRLIMVQDNSKRVIPSIIYIPNYIELYKCCDFIIESLTDTFINDMNLLGAYKNKDTFPFTFESTSNYIFDGAAIGQYLGGVDPNNLRKDNDEKKQMLNIINNPTKGFINESSDFKINKSMLFYRKSVILNKSDKEFDIILAHQKKDNKLIIKHVFNLHIHSKQLYQFSSIFNIKYSDIITGDRILDLCDYIISTPDIYKFHQNINHVNDKIILIKDWNNINIIELNNILKESGKHHIKIFIYTHLLDNFINNILYHKNLNKIFFTIYLHNSDHTFGESQLHQKLINHPLVKHIYAQNINSGINTKCTLLPISLANSMWNHGDIVTLFSTMSKIYKFKKKFNIYININTKTFPYRSIILNELIKHNINIITETKPFNQYLEDLSTHLFCLCLRGNGLDTHRFWESLYLNVIPVIINNKYTKMNGFVQNLRHMNVPFYEINEDSLEDIVKKYFLSDFFNKDLYKKILNKINKFNILSIEQLKLTYYTVST